MVQPKREADDQQELEERQTRGQDAELERAQYSTGDSPLPPADSNAGTKIQMKLAIGQPNDRYEQEADRVADQVVNQLQPSNASSVQPKLEGDRPRITPLVMRQGEGSAAISPQAEQGIQRTRGGGEAISHPIRRSMEQALGADFSGVRIHADGEADQLNRSLNARAFTTGQDIYFKRGEYQPGTESGQKLLAHELTHVVQQNNSDGAVVQKLSGDYTIDQLRTYLQDLNRTGQINGSRSGDNMARDVVSAWLDDLTFSLTPRLKILLIRELQDGTVGDDDERAILALLQHSYNDEMSTLFGPGGINVDDLDSDMQGDEQDELDAFYESRFQGGKEAVRRGQIQTRGRQEPLLPTSREGWNRARIEDCIHQPSGVLPGRIGPLAELSRTVLVFQHFTEEELAELEQLIRANPEARRFVCTHGLGGLLAVSDTLNGTTIDIGAARGRLGDITAEINRPFLRRQRQSREVVGEVTEWARRESQPVTVPSMASIVGLPEEHRSSLERVLQLLQRNSADVRRLSDAFQQAVTAATNIPTSIQAAVNSSNWSHSRFPFEQINNASSAVESVVTALRETNRYMEMAGLIEQAGTLHTTLETMLGNYMGELSDDQRNEARDHLRELRQSAYALRDRIRARAQSIPSAESFERVRFLLTYFLAMNNPSRADTTTTKQRQQFIASMAGFNDDLRAVFGTGGLQIRSPIELLEVLGSRLGEQMSVRNQMEQHLHQDPGAVPGMVTVRTYFQSLRGQSLAIIEHAYEHYAGAYFEHRGLASQADLAVDEFSDLFDRPIGIGGTRLLVCSGFARLGAELLVDAGATLQEYRIRFHYTPAEVQAQSFSDGHAVARLILGGTQIWVSNQSIFHSLAQAMSVAWTNPGAPSVEGTGLTFEAATNALSFPSN